MDENLRKVCIVRTLFTLVCNWGKTKKIKSHLLVSARCIHSFVHSFKKRGKNAVETGEGKKKTKELLFENLKSWWVLTYLHEALPIMKWVGPQIIRQVQAFHNLVELETVVVECCEN